MRIETIPCSATSGFTIPATIAQGNHRHQALAFVDSGAAGSFMDYEMAKRIDVQPVTLQKSLNITAVDGSPLGTGKVSQCTPPLQL